jgi:hypothetical protein
MEHPNKDSLAAFIENTLQKDKHDEIETHLKDCEECRSSIAAYAASLAGIETSATSLKKSNNLTWILSIATALLIGLALFFFLQARESKKNTQMATGSVSSNTDEAYLTSSGVKKNVQGKTFRLIEKIWIDEAYQAAGKPAVTEFSKNSQAYSDLVAAKPALKPYAEAGLNVIVLFDNQAYKFTQ